MHLLKQYILWITISTNVTYALALPLVWLDYQVRKEYISEVLCINKDKPELSCHGKCFLTKQLEDAKEKQEEQSSERGFSYIFCSEFDHEVFTKITVVPVEIVHRGAINSLCSFDLNAEIFHPPLG